MPPCFTLSSSKRVHAFGEKIRLYLVRDTCLRCEGGYKCARQQSPTSTKDFKGDQTTQHTASASTTQYVPTISTSGHDTPREPNTPHQLSSTPCPTHCCTGGCCTAVRDSKGMLSRVCTLGTPVHDQNSQVSYLVTPEYTCKTS